MAGRVGNEEALEGQTVVLGDEPLDGKRIVSTAETMAAPLSDARASAIQRSEEGPPVVADRYEILGMLGGGAMGTVYRARDRELDEVVALKVLRRELASSPDMLERFRREVKLARRVTHRNVARTFDIGDHEGERFLTMELVRGEGLGGLLARRGQLDGPTVAMIARDVCAGLDAAHTAGVLHRDLKPENVVLAEDGRAVLTDFGIARAAASGETTRTAAGGIIGTPAYMAPEQVEGKDLDGRADLYALGAMMYELLSGALAWPGDNVMAVASARLVRPPPDVRHVAHDVPDVLAELVLRLMARRPEERPASAAETFETLEEFLSAHGATSVRNSQRLRSRAPITPAAVMPRARRESDRTVAVLPLANLGAPDDEYLTQTVTEDLVDLLSVVPNLRVLPRGHTVRFVDPSRDVRVIGQSLEVDVVVDASLRRIGDAVRIAVRLITVADGFQLWARRFDRTPAKVLTVADEAASAIAEALTTERAPSPARHATTDSVAQEHYLRGRYLMNRGWFEQLNQAVELLREASSRAPGDGRIGGTFALAVARLLGTDPRYVELEREGRAVAERVLALDPAQAEARLAIGLLHHQAHETTAAVREMKRALAINPNLPDGLDSLGRILIEVGRTSEGLAMLDRVLAIDPGMTQARTARARIFGLYGDETGCEALLGPPPDDLGDLAGYLMTRGRSMLWNENVAGARAFIARNPAHRLGGYSREIVEGMLRAAATPGLSPADLERLRQVAPHDRRFAPRRVAFLAQIRTELKIASGDFEEALEDLRAADAAGLIDVVWLDRCHLLRKIRQHPVFQAVRTNVANRASRVLEAVDAAG